MSRGWLFITRDELSHSLPKQELMMAEQPQSPSLSRALAIAEKELPEYLENRREQGTLTGEYLETARENVLPNLRKWLHSPGIERLSPNAKQGICQAIEGREWKNIVNAFARRAKFGTGGIRGLMGFDRESIRQLQQEGLDAPILKGPATINNLVLLQYSYGVARFLADQAGGTDPRPAVVVGHDSRIRGQDLAEAIAGVFLEQDIKVYLFDEAVPYPEVTFAIPTLGADIGTFISASHNDYRYNGYKLSGPHGAQISQEKRNIILNEYILATEFEDVTRIKLDEATVDELGDLYFLGGNQPVSGRNYYGRAETLYPLHREYLQQVRSFLLNREAWEDTREEEPLQIAYSAFNGAGGNVVPDLFRQLGLGEVHSIESLLKMDGMFPAFDNEPGEEQEPDPGDPRIAKVALEELDREAEEANPSWKDMDLLIGTDPDADRCGVVVKPPEELADKLRDHPSARYSENHVLLPADDLWALLLWYRLHQEFEEKGKIENVEEKFIAFTHTTSQLVPRVARKFGLGALQTWVGFAWLSEGVAEAWRGDMPLGIKNGRRHPDEERAHDTFFDTTEITREHQVNFAAMEQSNGFSIFGSRPDNLDREMGKNGHVRDKDGTLASVLMAEVAVWAKQHDTDLMTLLARHLYSDPDIGLFINYYEPDPLDGEYPGLEGDTKKKRILQNALDLHERAETGKVRLGGRRVQKAIKYWTGKYDEVNWPGFPDEGLRFFFEDEQNYLTIRPSGTSNALRFHVHLHGGAVSEEACWDEWLALENEAREMVLDLREKLGAPRPEGETY